MKEETDGGEHRRKSCRVRQTRLLSLEKAESGFLPQKALRHFPQAGQKKNCSYPSDQNMDSSGGRSQHTLVEVRDVFTHTSTKHALKKTAFFARGAVFCVAILLQTSSRRLER